MQIEKRRNDKLYGSFIAVLNLTTDNAPTNPNERANEDLTTATREATLIVTINNVLPNEILEEKVDEKFQYRYLI